ncbi:MAG: response regulator transcription factor [Mycoplasmatales bacterium]
MLKVFVILNDKLSSRAIENLLNPTNKYSIILSDKEMDYLLEMDKFEPDIVVVDINSQKDVSDWNMVNLIRTIKPNVPLLVSSDLDNENDYIISYEYKNIEFIKKPLNPKLFVKKFEKLIIDNFNMYGSLRFEDKHVIIDNKKIKLSPKQIKVLQYLILKDKVCSQQEILTNIWGTTEYNSRVIDSHIKRLRQALGNKSYLIKTKIGQGYYFSEDK